MSDYFGALLRSSGLAVAPAALAHGRSRSEAAAAALSSEPAIHDASTEFVELDITREIEPREVERPARLATPVEPAASLRESPLRHQRGEDEPLAPASRAGSQVNGEHEDLVRLRRAAAEAAIRWVAADPVPQRPAGAPPGGVLRVNPRDTDRASDRREVSKAEAATVPAARSVFAPTAEEGVSLAQFEVASRENSRVSDRASQSAPRQSPSPIEEVVDVSIGAIHVHVDGPPPKPAAPGAGPRDGDGPRERPRSSDLERRYLRAI